MLVLVSQRLALLSSVFVAEVRKLVLYITPNLLLQNENTFLQTYLQDQGIRVRFFPDDLQKDHLNLLKRNEVDIVFGSIKLLRQTKLWSNVHLVVSEEIGIQENLTGRGQVSEKDEGCFWYNHSYAFVPVKRDTKPIGLYTNTSSHCTH